MPGPSTEGRGRYVVNLAKASGCRPDFPIAARTRNVEKVSFVQSSPELGTKEIEAFG